MSPVVKAWATAIGWIVVIELFAATILVPLPIAIIIIATGDMSWKQTGDQTFDAIAWATNGWWACRLHQEGYL